MYVYNIAPINTRVHVSGVTRAQAQVNAPRHSELSTLELPPNGNSGIVPPWLQVYPNPDVPVILPVPGPDVPVIM